MQTDYYDTTIRELLHCMETEVVNDARCKYLEVLLRFINSMQMKMVRFLPSLFSILDTYTAAGCTIEVCADSLKVSGFVKKIFFCF